jgi:hypothetical protein
MVPLDNQDDNGNIDGGRQVADNLAGQRYRENFVTTHFGKYLFIISYKNYFTQNRKDCLQQLSRESECWFPYCNNG